MIELLLGVVIGFMIGGLFVGSRPNVGIIYKDDEGNMFVAYNGTVYRIVKHDKENREN